MRAIVIAIALLLPSAASAQFIGKCGLIEAPCDATGCRLTNGRITTSSTTLKWRNVGDTESQPFTAGTLSAENSGTTQFTAAGNGGDVGIASTGDVCWSANANANGTKDTCLRRSAAGVLALVPTAAATTLVKFAYAQAVGTIAADDVTPDVTGALIWTTTANTGATAITDLDNPSVGQVVIICGGSATNSSTIADSGNFNLSAAFTAGLDDCIALYVQADNDYIELYRVNN